MSIDTGRVTGFLIPTFTQMLPNGKMLNGIESDGFRRIMEGYACGECMATFDRFTLVCPLCGEWYDPNKAQQAPQIWLDHIAARELEDPPDKPAVVNPFAAVKPHEAIDAKMKELGE